MIVRTLVAIVLAGSVALAQDSPVPPKRMVGGVVAGKILHKAAPRYPPDAKAAGIGGTVLLKGTIEKDGILDHLEVVSGPPELRQAAVDAASQWTYEPYLLNGMPTSVDTRIAINFKLDSETAPPDPNAPKPVRVSSGVMAGQILERPTPKGKPDWGLEHSSGTAVFRAIIGKDGKVKDLSPISGSAMVQAYFFDSVLQWRYHPYLLNGQPVEVETTITINSSWEAPPASAGQTPLTEKPAPVQVSGGVMQGLLITKVTPTIPPEAREQHVNGAVVCHVLIGKDGRVKDIQVISGPELLRKAYTDAFRQWVYRPYLLNGEPVEVDTTIMMTMQFGGQ